MLLDDQLSAQRNHEEHAEPAADQSEQKDARVFEREAEEDQRWKRENHAARDGLAGGAGGLHDVVFEDADRPNARRMLMESTAMGIDAETVSPARRPT